MRGARYLLIGVTVVGAVSGGRVFLAANVVPQTSLGQLTTTAAIPLVCSSKVTGGLTVSSGQSYLTTSACAIDGGVSVESGGSFTAVGGVKVDGGVVVHTGGTFILSTGDTVNGGVTVYSGGTFGPGSGNTITGGVTNKPAPG